MNKAKEFLSFGREGGMDGGSIRLGLKVTPLLEGNKSFCREGE